MPQTMHVIHAPFPRDFALTPFDLQRTMYMFSLLRVTTIPETFT